MKLTEADKQLAYKKTMKIILSCKIMNHILVSCSMIENFSKLYIDRLNALVLKSVLLIVNENILSVSLKSWK